MTLPTTPAVAPAPHLPVEVHDLFCLYPLPLGTVAALRGLSLTVAPGERLVVVGPNGSGKTTLLKVLAGEVAPSAGRASIAGVDLAAGAGDAAVRLRRDRLGLVDQRAARSLRPELDVRDNVGLQLRVAGTSRAEARARATSMLADLGLSRLADRRPETLSGGEAQRVAVAAALAHGPSVVLADEPTGELDVFAADEVYDLLVRAVEQSSAALVLVTHDERAQRIADRVVRIRDGRLGEEWLPGGDERLVVDDRGWVRLPEPMRRSVGATHAVRAEPIKAGIVLHGTGESIPVPVRTAPVVSVVDGPNPAAEASRVSIAYDGRVVVSGIDVTLMLGRLVVIGGRSGSGKSSLLRVLVGLDRPAAGTVLLAGQDLSALDRSALAALRRTSAAVAGQGVGLAESLDVLENCSLSRDARGLPADPDRVNAWVDHLGLRPMVGRAVGLLSGGERQRVAIARALVAGVPLIVLDEPTSQLDETHAELVAEVLVLAAQAGHAVVCATHDPVVLGAADHVLALDASRPSPR